MPFRKTNKKTALALALCSTLLALSASAAIEEKGERKQAADTDIAPSEIDVNGLVPLVTVVEMEPSDDKEVKKAQQLVEKKLVRPLAKKEDERSKYSRARMPPTARRVRVIDAAAKNDAKGDAFFPFAVDEQNRFDLDNGWQANALTGCVYPTTGAVFVKHGDGWRTGERVLGKKKAKSAPAHVCQAG